MAKPLRTGSSLRFLAAATMLLCTAAFGALVIADVQGPRMFTTIDYKIRVVTVADNLVLPYSLAFLPDGSGLVTQLDGKIRIIKNGMLTPTVIGPIPGIYVNPVPGPAAEGLMDIALHPQFAANHLVYLTYSKPAESGHTVVLARATYTGSDLVNIQELFVTNAVATDNGNAQSRLVFDRDGLLYMSVSHHNQDRYSQDLANDGGKVLRLRDDGTPASGNPFIGQADKRPEIYTYGHRAIHGIGMHPETGEIWVAEHGDEVNVLRAGGNYGWPFAGVMGQGGGNPTPPAPRGTMLIGPYLSWNPALNISGLTFYTGNRFPKWKGNLFVGGLQTGQVHRVAFYSTPKQGTELFSQLREALFTGIGQRVRDVRQGPDGLIYFVTYGDTSGTVMRIEPAS